MRKRRIHKRNYRKRPNKSLGLRFTIVVGLVSIVLVFTGVIFYKNYKVNYNNYSLSTEGLIEAQQTTIPSDVQKLISEQERVLGSKNIAGWAKALPASVRVPILMYHYVEYVRDPQDKMRISLNTTPYTLEKEIKTLLDDNYTFMTNSELMDVLDGKKELPPKPIILTFDDGYRDFYTDVYPILKKYNVKATQYVIAGFLDRPNHLLISQLQEIASDGLVEIGAHTVNHVWLKGSALKTVQYEVIKSKEILEKLINKPVVSFAYPFGAFDAQSIKVVQEAGFRTATSTIPGVDQPQTNRYFLYRLRPGGRTGEDLLSFLKQKTIK